MRRLLVLISAFILAFISLTPAAFAAGTATPNATTLTLGDTLTVTVNGGTTLSPTVIDQGGFTNTLASTTGACTLNQHGSYTNGGQISTYTCTGPDVLTAVTSTATSQNYSVDGAFAFTVKVNAPVVVTPPPAPAPHYVVTTGTYPTATTPYVVTIKNDGNAAGVTAYRDSYYNPASLSLVTIPAGSTIAYPRTCVRNICRQTRGFVVSNITIPAGQTATITAYLTAPAPLAVQGLADTRGPKPPRGKKPHFGTNVHPKVLGNISCWFESCISKATDCAWATLSINSATMRMYTDQGCTGTGLQVTIPGTYEHFSIPDVGATYGQIMNDSIDSFTFGGKVHKIILYQDINYGGCSMTIFPNGDGYQSGWDLIHTNPWPASGFATVWNTGTSACNGKIVSDKVSSFDIYR
jgi:hypothetical protein